MRLVVLLDIHSLGSDPCDGAELAAALRAQGIEPLVLVRGSRPLGTDADPSHRGVRTWPGLRGYGQLAREFKPDHVVRVEPSGGSFYWRLAAAFGGFTARAWPPTGAPPANWGVDSRRASRSRLALWDGDYVLCPAAVDPSCGASLLAAFARSGEEHPLLDLVVLADPQRDLVRVAERLEISARVHFAGQATREAEWAWIEHAHAVAVVPRAPVSAGLLLRCWSLGRPPIVCHGFPGAIWVDHGRTGWCCQPEAVSLGRALREALTPGPALRLMMEASRGLAAQRTWEHAARTLGDLVGASGAPTRSARVPAPSEARRKAA